MTEACIGVGANTGEIAMSGVETITGIAMITAAVEQTRVSADRAAVAAAVRVVTTAAVPAEMVAPTITGSAHTAVIGKTENGAVGGYGCRLSQPIEANCLG